MEKGGNVPLTTLNDGPEIHSEGPASLLGTTVKGAIIGAVVTSLLGAGFGAISGTEALGGIIPGDPLEPSTGALWGAVVGTVAGGGVGCVSAMKQARESHRLQQASSLQAKVPAAVDWKDKLNRTPLQDAEAGFAAKSGAAARDAILADVLMEVGQNAIGI